MTDTLEHLTALDEKMQLIMNLLTQAVQATQEVAQLTLAVGGKVGEPAICFLDKLDDRVICLARGARGCRGPWRRDLGSDHPG